MKYTILLLILLSSCNVHKNLTRNKEATATKITTHSDSTGRKVTDSTAFTRIKHKSGRHITERIDTAVTVGGDSMEIFTFLPEKGMADTFKEGGQTIILSRSSKGKIGIKSSVAAKTVTVQTTRDITEWQAATEEIAAAVHRDETSHVQTSANIDSSRTTQSVVKVKESHVAGKWWLWLIVVVALGIVAAYRYLKK